MSMRSIYLTGFIIVCALLLTSIYFQMFKGMMPCPLCTLQRISFGLLGILFLIGMFITGHAGRLIINILCALASIAGLVFAGRQVWLQHFPSANSSECGVSLQYMMQVLPVNEVIGKIFSGSAECTERGWEFIQLNMAEWALLCFAGFLVVSLWLLVRQLQR